MWTWRWTMYIVQLAIKLSCGHIHVHFFASTVDRKWKTFRCNLVANLWKCCLDHVEMSSCMWNVGNWITTKAVVWRSRKTTCTFHRALLFTTITVGDLPSALVLWFIGFPLHPSTPPTTMIVQQPTAKSALCNAGIFYFQCSLAWDDVQWWIVVENRKSDAKEKCRRRMAIFYHNRCCFTLQGLHNRNVIFFSAIHFFLVLLVLLLFMRLFYRLGTCYVLRI